MDADLKERFEQIKKEQDLFIKAKLILALQKDKQLPLVDVAKNIGLKPSYLSHILRLNKLPELIVDGYYSQQISISHLFIISRLKNVDDMFQVYESALADDLSALQTQDLVREKLYQVKNVGEHIPLEEVKAFINLLTKEKITVKVIQTRIKGKIIIEIKGELVKTSAELRRIMKLIEAGQI